MPDFDANEDPTHPELEHSFDQRDTQQKAGIQEQSARADGVREPIDARLDDQRHRDSYRLGNQQCSEAEDVTLIVTSETRL